MAQNDQNDQNEQKESLDSGLLDVLYAECGCGYLSDLRLDELSPTLSRVLRRIPYGRWTGAAWQEAARYITGEREAPADEDGARALLERWLHQ